MAPDGKDGKKLGTGHLFENHCQYLLVFTSLWRMCFRIAHFRGGDVLVHAKPVVPGGSEVFAGPADSCSPLLCEGAASLCATTMAEFVAAEK